jgi:hypothetical protein
LSLFITGTFDSIVAPTFNGLTFNVVQNATLLVLQVGNAPYLAGDYNNDGVVNAADNVEWRKYSGTTTALLNDPHGGTIGANQFSIWRVNFGQISGNGGLSNATVPEPAAALLLVLGAATGCWRRIPTRLKSSKTAPLPAQLIAHSLAPRAAEIHGQRTWFVSCAFWTYVGSTLVGNAGT